MTNEIAVKKTVEKRNFYVNGAVQSRPNGKWLAAIFHLSAEDKAFAKWQINHGVINSAVQKRFPVASVKIDMRTLK